MNKNYFYIIQRDRQIFEIQYTQKRFEESCKQWQVGGLIAFATLGVMINGIDIVKILNADQYQNYIDSVQPKMYICDGTWYDTKEKSVIRYEVWKQKEIDEQKQIEQKPVELTSEEKERIQKKKQEITEKLNSII